MKVSLLIPKLSQAQPLKETRAAHQMAGDHPAPHHSQKDPPHTGFPPPLQIGPEGTALMPSSECSRIHAAMSLLIPSVVVFTIASMLQ